MHEYIKVCSNPQIATPNLLVFGADWSHVNKAALVTLIKQSDNCCKLVQGAEAVKYIGVLCIASIHMMLLQIDLALHEQSSE